MRVSTAIATFLLFCGSTISFAASGDSWCRSGVGQLERAIGQYKIRVETAQGEQNEKVCRAALSDSAGKELFSVSEVGISINPVSGASVTNDRVKSLVLEGFSGGAHCCWTYWIVALGNPAGLVKEIRNQTGIAFERNSDGRILLRTADGAFDYFDDLPHAFAPMPTVYLQLQGHDLHDVSAQFVPQYDKMIAEARQYLAPERINEFRTGGQVGIQSDSSMEIKTRVLSVVLSYLYSGRDQQAWNALDEMWPAADRERIAKLIVETRARGILAQTLKAQ